MSGAYDDLAPGAVAAALPPDANAPAPNAYSDLAPPTATPMPKKGVPGDAIWNDSTGFLRPAGAAVRHTIEGLMGLPVMAGNVGVGLGNLVNKGLAGLGVKTYPEHELSTPGNTESALLDQYFPHDQGLMEHVAGFIESGLAGGRVPSPTGSSVPSSLYSDAPGAVGSAARQLVGGSDQFTGTAANAPPANFMTLAQALAARRAQQLQEAQARGFVVPPSTTNPTAANKTIETIGGKIATQQGAAVKNQLAFDNAAKEAVSSPLLGINVSQDAPLTQGALDAVRKQAGEPYEELRGLGRMQTSPSYGAALDALYAKYKGAEVDFPDLARKDIADEIDTIRKPSFTGNSAVSAMQILRDKASKAYAGGDTGLGAVYKGMSKALEDEIEQHLTQAPYTVESWAPRAAAGVNAPMVRPASGGPVAPFGSPARAVTPAPGTSIAPASSAEPTALAARGGAAPSGGGAAPGAPGGTTIDMERTGTETVNPGNQDLLDRFREGRRVIARTYTVQEALNPGSEHVNGQKLGDMLKRGDYMDGPLRTAAQFGASFRRASEPPTHSMGVAHLDAYGSMLGAGLGEHFLGGEGHGLWGLLVGGAAVPTSRAAARAYMLSKIGQGGAVPDSAADVGVDPSLFGAAAGVANR